MKGTGKAANGADAQENMAAFYNPLLWDFVSMFFRGMGRKRQQSVRKVKSRRQIRS